MIKRVALCTLEVQGVPHERFPDRLLLAVENAIRTAWLVLTKKQTRSAICEASEPEITNGIRNILNDMLSNNTGGAFSEKDFRVLIVGGELESYDGQHIQKEPDIVFYCRDRRPGTYLNAYDGIFAECKLIDQPKKKTVSMYAIDGITKFIKGEYAWAMRHAMMVAYVRDEQQMPVALEQNLNLHGGGNICRFAVVSDPPVQKCTLTRKQPPVYITRHQRAWPHRDGSIPQDIELRHLWVYLPER